MGLILLSGSRDCVDQNNDSLVVLVGYKTKRFLFPGDAKSDGDEQCLGEIPMLIERYQKMELLKADVLKVNLHGSANGMTEEWIRATSRGLYLLPSSGSRTAARDSMPAIRAPAR